VQQLVSLTLPDGRGLYLEREGPMGEWVGRIDGPEPRTSRHRWLLMVLIELCDLPPGRKPEWVDEVVREASGQDTQGGRRFACPCCDHLTLTDPPTGTFAICPVCRWEDDNVQFVDVDLAGGANKVSLRQARANFQLVGASEPGRRERGRPPCPEEVPRS
jgi:Cysteine-rich CPCC